MYSVQYIDNQYINYKLKPLKYKRYIKPINKI